MTQDDVVLFVMQLRGHAMGLKEADRYDPKQRSNLTNGDSVSYGALIDEAADLIERLSSPPEAAMAFPECTCGDLSVVGRGHGDRCPTLRHPFNPDGSPKIAPVQGWTPGIPWSLHLEAYDAYRVKWGSQAALIDIERRGCRGGFSVGEMDRFVPGWRDRVSEIAALKVEIAALRSPKQGGEAVVRNLEDGTPCALVSTAPSAVEQVRAWPLNGYAPGNYSCRCGQCHCQFDGDKRAVVCLECAIIMSKENSRSARQAGLAEAAGIAERWRDENKVSAARARKQGNSSMADQLDGAAIECNAIAGEIRSILAAAGRS